MRWLLLALLTVATIMAQESFEYTTDRNAVRYQVPAELMGPPIATMHNRHLTSEDRRIFVTGYMSSSLFKDTALGSLNLSMVEWPEKCSNWSEVTKFLQEHLSVPGVEVTSVDRSWHGLAWKVFEQREAKSGKWTGISCYVQLTGQEILYVGLVLHDGVKVSKAQREAYRAAVYELLASIAVRNEGESPEKNADGGSASKKNAQSDANSLLGRGS